MPPSSPTRVRRSMPEPSRSSTRHRLITGGTSMRHRLDRVPRALSIAAISLLVSARAHAQSAEAEQLFSDGDRLMKQGKLGEACDAFEASNKLETRAGTLIR